MDGGAKHLQDAEIISNWNLMGEESLNSDWALLLAWGFIISPARGIFITAL